MLRVSVGSIMLGATKIQHVLQCLLAAVCCVPLGALADVYRCTQPDGKVIYQEMSCATASGSKEEKTAWTAAREREAAEKLKRKRERERDEEEAVKRSQARKLAKKSERATTAKDALNDGPPDCTDLYAYARARGQGWIMSSAIAEEAKRTGTCIDKKYEER